MFHHDEVTLAPLPNVRFGRKSLYAADSEGVGATPSLFEGEISMCIIWNSRASEICLSFLIYKCIQSFIYVVIYLRL